MPIEDQLAEHRSYLMRFARLQLRNEAWAEDAVSETMLAALSKPESLLTYVKDRPGHDRRYAIDASKIRRELGWAPRFTFDQALPLTMR